MQGSEWAHAADFIRVVRRNNSLDSGGRQRVFASLFVISIGIALGFAWFGAWLILPFAGLEMAVLYLAFRWVERRAGDYERIAIAGDRLEIEVCEAGRAVSHQLSRYWTRLVSAEGGARIALRSQGREVAIGRFLSDDQRRALARELGRELGGGVR